MTLKWELMNTPVLLVSVRCPSRPLEAKIFRATGANFRESNTLVRDFDFRETFVLNTDTKFLLEFFKLQSVKVS